MQITDTPSCVDMVHIFQRQLESTLQMLQRAIADCPDTAWEGDAANLAVWQHAYHALLGLSIWLTWPTPAIAFPPFHRPGLDAELGIRPPLTRQTLEAYRCEVFAKVHSYIARLTPASLTEELLLRGKRFTRADLIMSQIRHVQHHVGGMHAQLRWRTGSSPAWVAYGES